MARMRNSGRATVLVFGFLAGCSTLAPTSDPTAFLLTIPVRATQPQPYVDFNHQIAAALPGGATWPMDAHQVAWQFVSLGSNRSGALSWQGDGEHPGRYRVVAINDRLLDDSVRSRRLSFDIERQADESWRVVDAQLSWRCWRKADDESFGVDSCP